MQRLGMLSNVSNKERCNSLLTLMLWRLCSDKKLPPQLLERLIKSSEKLEKSQIKAIGHRV
jgi:hypothetical protein